MITRDQIRSNYRRICEGIQGRSDMRPKMIAKIIAEQIGLCDEKGRAYTRADGFPTIRKDAKFKASDFNLQLVTEAILGEDWKSVLGLENSGNVFPIQRWLAEESAAPIGPSTFMNVAAWSATVGGLMQAQTLEGYEQAPFDVADLFPTRQAIFWQGGERYVDILGPYIPAPEVAPGEQHPNMPLSGLWVQPGTMKKYGCSMLIAKETAWIDITGGQMMSRAKTNGEALKFRENELALSVITGQTNNWALGMLSDSAATVYNTYSPSITNPQGVSYTLVNDHVNALNDFGAFTAGDLLTANLKHPITGLPINVNLDTVLLPTPLESWAKVLTESDSITLMNQTAAAMAKDPPGGGTFPNLTMTGPNPYKGRFKPMVSKWLHHRHTASTTQTDPNLVAGLGLTGSAVYRWYRMDPQKFACRRAAWEANVIDLNPGDYQMAMQGIIAGQVGNIAVMYQVLDPYAIQRNKSA